MTKRAVFIGLLLGSLLVLMLTSLPGCARVHSGFEDGRIPESCKSADPSITIAPDDSTATFDPATGEFVVRRADGSIIPPLEKR